MKPSPSTYGISKFLSLSRASEKSSLSHGFCTVAQRMSECDCPVGSIR